MELVSKKIRISALGWIDEISIITSDGEEHTYPMSMVCDLLVSLLDGQLQKDIADGVAGTKSKSNPYPRDDRTAIVGVEWDYVP